MARASGYATFAECEVTRSEISSTLGNGEAAESSGEAIFLQYCNRTKILFVHNRRSP